MTYRPQACGVRRSRADSREPQADNDSVLWQWQGLLRATAGTACGPVPTTGISGISIDSRDLTRGDLFVALAGDPGPRFQATTVSDRNGHDFLAQASAAGAAAALISKPGGLGELPGILVADTLDALWAMARYRRNESSAQRVAVTGSSGKTTAKSLLAAACSAWAEPGSLNNHIGVPLSLARTPMGCDAAVYEVGTNHPGEIAPLSELVAPHVAIVLNVHSAHIGNFGGFQALLAEKMSLAEGVVQGGTLIREASLPASSRTDLRQITFGTDANAMIRLDSVEGNIATFRLPTGSFIARIPGGGEHRALSLAAVIATLIALGRDPEAAADLGDDLVPAGRGQAFDVAGIQIIDDSYNANPDSMTASIRSFSGVAGKRSFALLGEMLELGADSDRYHQDLALEVTALEGFWAVGEGMRVLEDLPNYLGWTASADDELLVQVVQRLIRGDAVLVKGSNRVFWAKNFVSRLRLALGQRSAG